MYETTQHYNAHERKLNSCMISGFCHEADETLFWIITQLVVVIPYRRFGTTYLPSRVSRNVGMFTWSFWNFYYY